MAEKLGEAILELRTDDSQLTGGIEKAKGQAEGLAGTFRSTSASASGSLKSVGTAATEMASKAQVTARAATSLGSEIRHIGMAGNMARFQLMELSHVGTSLSGALIAGINPLRAFAMEMPRIAQAATMGQGGFLGMARSLLAMVAPFTAILAPAALLAGAFLGIKQAADKAADMQAFIQTLGLTKKEIGELKDATVTWGDVFSSTMDLLLERAGTSAEGVKSAWQVALDGIVSFSKFSISVLVAGFGALVRGVGSAFVDMGKIVANVVGGMVNGVIGLIESMINMAVSAVNSLADGANAAIGKLPAGIRAFLGLDGGFGHIGTVTLGRVQGHFDLSNPLTDMKNQFYGTFNDIMGGFDKIAAGAAAKTQARIRAQADSIKADRDATGATDGHTKALKGHTAAVEKDANALLDRARAAAKEAEVSKDLLDTKPLTDGAGDTKGVLAGLQPVFDALDRLTAKQEAQRHSLAQFADQLSSSITDVVMGTKSLGQAFSEMARSVIGEIIQMTLKMLIFRALASAFHIPIGSGSSGGSGFAGMFAGGGLIPSGTFGIVGEKGPEPVISTSKGAMVLPNSSLSSGQAANSNGAVDVRVTVEPSGDLLVKAAVIADARIQAAEPRIARNAASQTIRVLTRPKIGGR